MICIVDRIEETTAVCQREDRSVFTLPLSCLPQGVKEGDVLREENGVFKTDPDETSERRKRIRQNEKSFSLAPFSFNDTIGVIYHACIPQHTELFMEDGSMELILPKKYDPRLTIRETQDAIKYIRDTFQKEMGRELHLERISAPLFVEQSSGLNDNLNGVERPVQFDMAGLPGETLEVVHSLAKWKRIALKEYGFQPGEGLYTNMNAIRRDEELDNLHSCYVDQWDWER